MKKLIYSALIGSLAFALNAQAADEKHPKKAPAGHKPANAQKAAHGGRPAQMKVQHAPNARNVHAGTVQQKAIHSGGNRAAVVKQNNPQNNVAALHHNNASTIAAQKASRKQAAANASIARSQVAAVDPQQNVAMKGQGNFKNRQHNVAINNNWRSSHFSGQQYSAFRNYHRQSHDRNWYTSRYNRIVLFGGGNYYWDNGYWYPAWGYNSGYSYGYDGPIYGYNDLAPGDVVTNTQVRLQREGYYTGAIDGALGPMTRRALAAFQADHGLAITSAIDQPTLNSLGLI